MVQKIGIKYRTWFKGVAPRPIRLEIPGWAGEKNWESGQPWHCKPFVDGATYGLELIYPYDTEVAVVSKNGVSEFLFEDKQEWSPTNVPLPFMNFAPNHFGFTSSIDIQTEPGWGTMIFPHPRFFTDMTGTVPLPVHGMIESDWWSNIFFLAFKAPLEGQKHVFRKGDGIAHLIFVPKEVEYNVQMMSVEESKARAECEQLANRHAHKVANRKWIDKDGQTFDNKYKVLSLLAKKDGPDAVRKHLRAVDAANRKLEEEARQVRSVRMKRSLVKGNHETIPFQKT